MKKVIALMLGLAATTASFAQTATATETPAVVVSMTGQKVNVFVAPQPTTASIRLFDASGHVLYDHTASAARGLRERLNLTELEPGTYRLTVVENGQTTQKTLVIGELPTQRSISLEA